MRYGFPDVTLDGPGGSRYTTSNSQTSGCPPHLDVCLCFKGQLRFLSPPGEEPFCLSQVLGCVDIEEAPAAWIEAAEGGFIDDPVSNSRKDVNHSLMAGLHRLASGFVTRAGVHRVERLEVAVPPWDD